MQWTPIHVTTPNSGFATPLDLWCAAHQAAVEDATNAVPNGDTKSEGADAKAAAGSKPDGGAEEVNQVHSLCPVPTSSGAVSHRLLCPAMTLQPGPVPTSGV